MQGPSERSSLTGAVKPTERSLAHWRTVVYCLTFLAYANSHFSRKGYTNVKAQLKEDAGVDPILLGQMDTTFMFFYAIGSFFSGRLGDILHPPTVVAAGLVGSACCVLALAACVWSDVEQSPALARVLLLGIWLCHGLFQSTGGPVNTAIMGSWFGAKNRGFIFGTWTCHQYVGNIVAALVASAILGSSLSWVWALLIPAIANLIWGCVCYACLPARPEDVGVVTEEMAARALLKQREKDAGGADVEGSAHEANSPPPISFMDALRIPNVLSYAFAFGFFKLINYCMFFWLPYFFSQHYTAQQSNLISTLYDIGMMPGGIIVGYVSDLYGGRRACVIATFMTILLPLLFLFAQSASTMPAGLVLVLLGAMGILVGGPNNIITSAVAADLAEHPSIRGNNRALGTVTGIINGSGSITAAIGLLFIGPMQVAWGWSSVWYFLILCTIMGTLLMSGKVYKELYYHEIVDSDTSASATEMTSSARRGGYQTIPTREDQA